MSRESLDATGLRYARRWCAVVGRAALVATVCTTRPVVGGEIGGRVTDLNGRPIAHAALTLDPGEQAAGVPIVTVFTDATGVYRFPTEHVPAGGTLQVSLLGYERARRPVAAPAKPLDFALAPASNVADQAPAAAWLAGAPESDGKHLTQLMCTACHQFPTAKVKQYAMSLTAVPGGEQLGPTERTAWQRRVRHESWRAMVMFMRAKTYDIFPEGTSIDIRKIPWDVVQNPEYALFNHDDEAVIADFLADHLPGQFDFLAGYDRGAPAATNGRTVIREYRLPATSLVRELTVVPGASYLWGADVQRNRLLRLDPQSGEQRWFPVPYEKATGPHTIIGDTDGNLWVSMIESDLLGRFDPATEQWKLWKLNETGTDVFGGQAVVHDIAFGYDGRLARDPQGRVWLTLVGSNKMASLDPQTGEVHHYAAPPVAGRAGINITLYGTLLSADGGCAWFSQLNGYVGCFNTATLQYEALLTFAPGTGPRRMSIDRNDVLWIPLYGAGQVLKYDARARRELGRYALPDRGSGPYAVTWDERRQVLWVATSNADAVYRFEPRTATFTVLPLPRQGSFLRQLVLHPETNDLVLTYGHIPVGSGPSMAVVVEIGD